MRYFVSLSIVFLSASLDYANAQRPARDGGSISICHGANTYSMYGSNGVAVSTDRRIQGDVAFALRRGEAVSIWIEDPNPLLFAYTSRDVDRVERADYAALGSLVNVLRRFVPAPGETAADAGIESVHTPLEIVTVQLRELVSRVYSLGERVPELIRQTALAGTGCTEATKAARRVVRDEVAEWQVSTIAQQIDARYGELESILWEILTEGMQQEEEPEEEEEEEGQDELSAMYLALLTRGLESDVRATLEEVQAFARDVGRIDEPVRVVDRIAFDPRYDQRVGIDVALVAENGAAAESAGRFIGRIVFVASPDSAFETRVAPAVVWTSLSRRMYERVDGSEGSVIGEKINYLDGAQVSAMVNFVPQVWRWPSVSGLLQIGATELDGGLVVLGGGGLALLGDVLTVSVGAAVTNGEKLEEGTVGDMVAEGEIIGKGRKVNVAVYWSLGLSF